MTEQAKADHLGLRGNSNVTKMLDKLGSLNEMVHFSDFVTKINKRGREQTRVLLITDKACYNLMPNNYGKCKRRIALEAVISVTVSKVSQELIIHVPDEYDYRYKSAKKDSIYDTLKALSKNKINVVHAAQDDLVLRALTKPMARLQSRDDIMRRKQTLADEKHDSDNEDKHDVSKVTPMYDSEEKVRLDDFELLKVLGRGSFGKVMQVRMKKDGTVYAMKILKKQQIIAKNQVEHTNAERMILQQLQHPFLMKLRYAFQSKEKLYFVLDYYQGGELFFHLKNNRRFPEDVAKIYVAEIGLALGHLHSLSVIYRDLKPENILLDANGHVCLTDFGLSKDVQQDERAHTFCGTPEYLAPEIILGNGHDKAVDWWSLGILCYELTVGIPPFYSQDVNEMYNKIQHGVLRFPPFLSEDCKALIIALLNRDPKKRMGSKDDVEDITSHAWFSDLDFDLLMQKKIDVSFKPDVKNAEENTDTENFDKTFTREPVVDSVVQGKMGNPKEMEDAFANFTFQQKGEHLS